VEWLFGYKYAHNDIDLEDFRSRDHMWELTTIAREFFDTLPVAEMRHGDALLGEGNAYCLAKPGEMYVIYLPVGGSTQLDLGRITSTFTVRWFDPRRGGKLKTGDRETVSGGGLVTIG